MWSKLTLFDVVLGVYFLFFFAPRWLGYIAAIIIGYRIVKDFLPGGDKIVYTLNESCTPLHGRYSRHPRA